MKEIIRKKLKKISDIIVDICMIDQSKYYIYNNYNTNCIKIEIEIIDINTKETIETIVDIDFYCLDTCFNDYKLLEHITKKIEKLNKDLDMSLKVLKDILKEIQTI